MLVIDTNHPKHHWWTGGEHNRFLTSFISPALQEEIKGFSIGMVIVPPHTKSGVHVHEKTNEIWYILAGTGKIQVGDDVRDVYPGLLVYGPPGISHQVINDSIDSVLKALLILNPDGDELLVLKNADRLEG